MSTLLEFKPNSADLHQGGESTTMEQGRATSLLLPTIANNAGQLVRRVLKIFVFISGEMVDVLKKIRLGWVVLKMVNYCETD